jgi:prophage antirepressor-like protein
MNEIQLFNFEGQRRVRVVIRDGEPWFVAKDVCDILCLENSRDTLAKMLDDDEADVEKIYTRSENGVEQKREMNIVNESGLYTLIMRSNKPEAKRFRRWVTHEVLPAIRKTGRYVAPVKEPTEAEIREAGRKFFTDCYREGGIKLYIDKRYPGKADVCNDPRERVGPARLLTRQEKRWLEEADSAEFLTGEGRL